MRTTRGMAVALAAIALLVAACSGSDGGTDAATDGSTGTGAGGGQDDGASDGGGASTTTPGVPAAADGFESALYGDDANWLCRPDLPSTVCRTDLDVTRIAADGATSVEPVAAVEDAPLDCFYVYPTVNLAGEGTNDLAMADDVTAESVVTHLQAAPFSSLCNLYVPLYRQVLLSGFSAPDAAAGFEMAYGDVRDAYLHYLAHWNDGRPVVLIGHSQGSGHLATLLSEEVEGDEEMTDLVEVALLIGGQVTVPAGEDVGGTFDEIPLCRAVDQRGCVVTYNSVAADRTPADDSIWTMAADGQVRACTNPAALSGGSAPLSSQMGASGSKWTVEGAEVDVTTPFAAFDGAVTGECVERDGRAWFAISPATGDADARNVAPLTVGNDFWELHLVDVNVAMGDLLAIVSGHLDGMG